jgi:hypothetical protein
VTIHTRLARRLLRTSEVVDGIPLEVDAVHLRIALRVLSRSDEGSCVVCGEFAHVTGVSPRHFANMGDRFRLTARVARVVLHKAVDLPRRHACGF